MTLLYACEAAATVADIELYGCPCGLDDLPYTIQELIDAASDALMILSGGVVTGRCERTLRPCQEHGCSCLQRGCGCCNVVGIPLPGASPTVISVKIDGVELEPTEYAMVDGHKLARITGYWPGWQNVLLRDTEVGSFSVTVEAGTPFDFLGKMAAVDLVCEMAATLLNEPTRLPKGTVAATADGVSIVIGRLPGQEEIQAVGLTWLGKFLAVYGSDSVVRVTSPDMAEGWVFHEVEFAS